MTIPADNARPLHGTSTTKPGQAVRAPYRFLKRKHARTSDPSNKGVLFSKRVVKVIDSFVRDNRVIPCCSNGRSAKLLGSDAELFSACQTPEESMQRLSCECGRWYPYSHPRERLTWERQASTRPASDRIYRGDACPSLRQIIFFPGATRGPTTRILVERRGGRVPPSKPPPPLVTLWFLVNSLDLELCPIWNCCWLQISDLVKNTIFRFAKILGFVCMDATKTACTTWSGRVVMIKRMRLLAKVSS